MTELLWEEIFGSLRKGDELRKRASILFESVKYFDDGSKIKRLLEDREVRNIMKVVSRETHVVVKSPQESQTLRERGNEYFHGGKMSASLWLYNSSVQHAPKGELLALAVGNRSAALFHLECYELCIRDIKFALDMAYPQDRQPKLYKRLGRCLMITGSFANAIDAFRTAENGLGDSISSETKGELRDLIEQCLVSLSEPLSVSRCSTEEYDESSELSFGTDSSMPYTSASLHVVQDSKKGRSVYAKKKLNPGDVLFYEPAYALVLQKNEKGRRCHSCVAALLAPIPCHSCVEAIYCSENCLNKAWHQYHRFECGYNITGEIGWAPMLSLRILLRAGNNLAEKIIPLVKNNDCNVCDKTMETMKQCSDDSTLELESEERDLYKRMEDLCSTIDKDTEWKRFLFIVAAVLISRFLFENKQWSSAYQKLNHCSQGSNKLLEHLAAIAFKHITQSAANNFLILDQWSDENLLHKLGWKHQKSSEAKIVKFAKDWDEVVASGVYISSSMLNHSCRPNSSHSFYKHYLIAKADEVIPEGKEVCIHYGQVYTRNSRKERQEFLKENCFFECECEACSNPSKFNTWKSRAYCCPSCSGPMVEREEMFEKVQDLNFEIICLECNEELNNLKYFKDGVDTGRMEYQRGMIALSYKDPDVALEHFQHSLQILQKFYFCENITIAQLMDKIALSYASAGNYEESINYIQLCLPIVESTYGDNSLEVAYELQKLVDIIFSAMVKTKDMSAKMEMRELCLQYIERALRIIHHRAGPWIHVSRYLEKMKLELS